MGKYGLLENYELLGTGVVEFALDDYRTTIKSLGYYYTKIEASLEDDYKPRRRGERFCDICYDIYRRIRNLNDIERFMTSAWVTQLTSLDTKYLFQHVQQRLIEKGYKVKIMGLTVTTDDKGVIVYAKELDGKNGKFTVYSLGVSSKDTEGKYINGYVQCLFKKGTVLANKAKIKINRSFFVVNKGTDGKTYPKLMITDFDILESGETAMDEADNYIKIADGAFDDDTPFL
jgi:hypothetical protein